MVGDSNPGIIPIRLQNQNKNEKSAEERQILRSAMADGIFGLAVHEIIDQLEGLLQLSGPVHRQAGTQEREQQDDDEQHQNLHHHEVGRTDACSVG